MRHFVQSAGMSHKPNFRKCNSTAQRSNGKGSKWLTRVEDQGGYEAPLRMAMADNAALQRKGVKGKGKSGEGKEGKEGKGLGKRSKGKGARLPLTDLVPEPDPEQKFIMVGSSEKTRMLHTDLLQASQDLLGIGIPINLKRVNADSRCKKHKLIEDWKNHIAPNGHATNHEVSKSFCIACCVAATSLIADGKRHCVLPEYLAAASGRILDH